MPEQRGADWARGILAVGLALVVIGAITGFRLILMAVGGLIILCVGVATAGQRKPGEKPETLLRPGDKDRPWRRG
ncbi:hypothetical protein AB0F11_24545 [Streptomyces sp. NPDC032472]|uniref:hypothetical protein n=1 Tax=Streptomyces sp. NPDC032472 TaxID=3155018 RepID=UPI0033F327E7